MPRLATVKVQYESKIKIYGQNLVYGEDLRSLTLKKIGATITFPEGLENTPLNMKFKQANTYTIQCMEQGISLKSERNNP